MPVLIDFNSFQHSRLETSISHFTGIKITEIDSFIKTNKLVLIIDNLSLNLTTNQKLKKFLTFFNYYPNVRLICSSLQLLDGQIPLEFIESDLYEKFEILYLKYFKSKQIVKLTEQWFSNIDIKDKEDKIENIINLLMALELPRTPLAVSMFLWIIEKQEDYHPINQSTMLENFIEKLFKKNSKDQLYYGEFDYRNKESLLASIANEMYQNQNDNYSLLFSRLLDFTVEHLKKRHFDYNAESILDHFIEVGLLVKDNSQDGPIIRFRFNCFFQYFLMKNMENKIFFDFVMNDDNYLSFYDEIDYFTGIKRNRSDILKVIIERMNLLFKDLKSDISNIDGGIDSFFISDISFSDKLVLRPYNS